jgi:ribose/xylose/arabinose/galactoside ABC-type transport system permease subunit
MQIRREDEEFINYLKLLGAGMGAILAVFAVFLIYNNAKNQLADQRLYAEKNIPLLALAALPLTPENSGQPERQVDAGLLADASQAQSKLARLEKGFWISLPLPALAVICAAAGVAGLIGGYWSVWLLSWIATLAMLKLIRSAYEIIWRVNPQFDGGKLEIQDDNNIFIERDKERVLPGILVLSVIVYYFAG